MRSSIRTRLQLWYGLVLTLAVVGFAAILYGSVRHARLREIDAQLESAAAYLDSALRAIPPHELLPEHLPPPPGPRRPPRWRDRGLLDLDPPNASSGPDELYFAVWRENGSLLKAEGLPDKDPPAAPGFAPPAALLYRHGPYREAVRLGPHGSRILVGRSMQRVFDELGAFALQLAGVGAAVLLVGLAGGWYLSARVVRPIAVISETASRISGNNLSERIDDARVDDELAELGAVLNATFDRLQTAFDQQTRFIADASHELRTPLAVIRSHAELALSRPRSGDEYRQALETCVRATTRMTNIVEGLLTLARADAGKLELRQEPVELDRLVEEVIPLLRLLGESKGLIWEVVLQSVSVLGDAEALTRVVSNLVSNAVQYNRPGGCIRVLVERAGTEAVLAIADTGCGVPEADQPHLFERFFRVDRARSRASGGTGLGLAICQSIVEAHGGTITFEPNEREGCTFCVRLPLAGDSGGGSVSVRGLSP